MPKCIFKSQCLEYKDKKKEKKIWDGAFSKYQNLKAILMQNCRHETHCNKKEAILIINFH